MSSLDIFVPIDIEDEVRLALKPYIPNVVAGDLPSNFSTPILRVRQTGECLAYLTFIRFSHRYVQISKQVTA